MAIGAWTNPLAFPGQTEVRWICADLDDVDSCAPPQSGYFCGVTTLTSDIAFQVCTNGTFVLLPPMFIDMASC